MLPVGPGHELPDPVLPPVARHIELGTVEVGVEAERSCDKVFILEQADIHSAAGQFFASGNLLRKGLVSGHRDEFGELPVGDFGLIHPEAIELDRVLRELIGLNAMRIGLAGEREDIRPHLESPARNPDHPGGSRMRGFNHERFRGFSVALRLRGGRFPHRPERRQPYGDQRCHQCDG